MNYAITDGRPIALPANPPAVSYKQAIQAINKKFTRFQQKQLQDSTRLLVYNAIAETMPGYWNGTPWDFNGTTQVPGEGNIACGYFVTTLLRDIGYKINRVKLAQQASSVIVKNTCKDVKNFGDIASVKKYIASLPDKSVGVVGLDFHTGFIIKNSTGAYFFHSNYINRRGVTVEPLEKSAAFGASKAFVVGVLNTD